MVIRLTAIAGLVVVASLLAAESASACSCVFTPPKKQLAQADGAVVARLLKVKPTDGHGQAQFVYRTGRVYKGKPRLGRGRRLKVSSPPLEASCGLSRRVGRLSGLFLIREDGRWHSNLCRQITARQMRRAGEAEASSRERPAGPGCSG